VNRRLGGPQSRSDVCPLLNKIHHFKNTTFSVNDLRIPTLLPPFLPEETGIFFETSYSVTTNFLAVVFSSLILLLKCGFLSYELHYILPKTGYMVPAEIIATLCFGYLFPCHVPWRFP